MSDGGEEGLRDGLYEDLITSAVEQRLAQLNAGLHQQRSSLPIAEAADRLAMHVAAQVEAAVASLTGEERAAEGVRLVEQVVRRLDELLPKLGLSAQIPTGSGEVLHAVLPSNPDGSPALVERPLIPVLDTTLVNNARGEPALVKQLASEIASADRIDAIIAFIRFSGIRPILDDLRRHCERGRPLRILTTVYTGSTEQRALDALAEIGTDIRVSYDTASTRLHAKAWIFHRRTGTSTAYVGSSNLTHQAQVTGLEWNVRVSGRRNPDLLTKVEAAFTSAWENGDFVPYDPVEFAAAMGRQQRGGDLDVLSPVELRPEPFQERLLEQLEASRRRGFHRNLLVSATGTGKTVMAAVDYARLQARLPRARLLFVAHRQELLDQARRTYRHALGEPAFGEIWVGGARPSRWEHVFASIQSIAAAGVDNIAPDHFDVVVVDEFHHAAAPTYAALLERVRPVEMIGMTATPERADGMPILHWFGDRIAAELRLWDAIDQQRLAPFHYYGIHDGADLRGIPWRRGRGYDVQELENVLTADHLWVRTVIRQVRSHVTDPTAMRALGFCVSVGHARFLAEHFTEAGIPAVAVSGDTPAEERAAALRGLRDGTINAVFSVDLFNEGVDIKAVDTLIMLRPTDSATIFLQQLGRGLRRTPGKSVCTVLDFVGHQNARFRFDLKYRALIGGSRRELEERVREDFPYLPAGCSISLDPVARDVVLRGIRQALPTRWPQYVAELQALVAAGHTPTLAGYLHHTGLELDDVYANNRSWSDLLAAAGQPVLASGPDEARLRRAIGRMRHIDDAERIDTYLGWLGLPDPPVPASPRQEALLRMLVLSVAREAIGKRDLASAAELLWAHPQVRAELAELLTILRDRIDHVHDGLGGRPDVPLLVHARYSRDEILAALHQQPKDGSAQPPAWREGVKWAADQHADIFVVTLDKAADHFSPTTRYRDYAISRNLFHWESQSTTSAASATGQRYVHHEARGSDVFLFARMSNADRSFWFLGPARYVSHEGERPMAITWRLDHPLPGDLYADFAAAAVA